MFQRPWLDTCNDPPIKATGKLKFSGDTVASPPACHDVTGIVTAAETLNDGSNGENNGRKHEMIDNTATYHSFSDCDLVNPSVTASHETKISDLTNEVLNSSPITKASKLNLQRQLHCCIDEFIKEMPEPVTDVAREAAMLLISTFKCVSYFLTLSEESWTYCS